jgi:PAS domain S-box-containing protein
MGIAVNRMKGGAFLDVNPAFERLTGFSREELLGRNALEVGIFGASQTQRLKKFYETIRREGQIPRYTTAAYRKDGAELHILLSACLIDVDGETCLLTTSMDVTDAHRLGEANAELEARIRERTESLDALDEAFRQKLRALDRAERQLALATKVFEHADEAVMITDREAPILSVNPAFTAITGYSSEEALGRIPAFSSPTGTTRSFSKRCGRPSRAPIPGAAKSGTGAETARPFRRCCTSWPARTTKGRSPSTSAPSRI